MAASDAFGNRDGDIWLIDWSLGEIRSRLSRFMSGREAAAWNAVSSRLGRYEANGVWLWEAGRSDEALRYLGVTTDAMARYSPSLHRVLMEERNLVMASRLLDIREANPGARTLVLVGRAHVEGLEELLSDPGRVRAGAKRYGLDVSPAERVRRVRVT